jgi:hypothetical protein
MQQEHDFDRLTARLSECLGRIEAEAMHLQRQNRNGHLADASCDLIEEATGELQELVATLVDTVDSGFTGKADLNQVAARSVQNAVRRSSLPLVVRTRLAEGLPSVACASEHLAAVFDRALSLAAGHAGAGGIVQLESCGDGHDVRLCIRTDSNGNCVGSRERGCTLQEFVNVLGGRCDLDIEPGGGLSVVIQMPAVVEQTDR